MADEMRRLEWIGGARETIRGFPTDVKRDIGHALDEAQRGFKSPLAKPLKGFGGARVFEIVVNGDDAYRAVYATQIGDAIWVLHAFQKKSKKGSELPQRDAKLIRARLKRAEEISNSG